MNAALKQPQPHQSEEKKENYIVTDDMEIYGVLKGMAARKEKLWSWQSKDKEDVGNRPVHYALVRKVDPIKKTIEIVPNNTTGFRFRADRDLFLYSTQKGIALKIKIRELDPFYITFSTPPRLNVLSKDFLTNIELVEKENEAANKHKRGVPRVRPRAMQTVTINKFSGEQKMMRFLQLYDISAGGMGMVVDDPAEFEVGEEIEVLSINDKELPKVLKGQVMAIRQMTDDEMMSDQFKVGIKFV